MRRFILIITAIMMLIGCVSCAAKETEIPEFAAPTPAIEKAEITPAPAPTEKPYSEYNEKLDSAEVEEMKASYVAGFGKKDLAELELSSDAIVLARITHKEIIHDEAAHARGTKRGTTFTELTLEKVFYSSEGLKAGDVIQMQEYCYLYEGSDGTPRLSTTGDYYPAREYESYLLFLEIQTGYETDHTAKYTPVDLWYGKYPVSTAVRIAENGWEMRTDEKEVPISSEMIFENVQKKYFSDEAVRSIIEREAEYQRIYEE